MPGMFAVIRKSWRRYRGLTGLPRELASLALALAFGLLVLPPMIWLAGHLTLGEYVRSYTGTPVGGPFALWADFFRGLASGSLGYWTALLGPWLLWKWLRISSALLSRPRSRST
jgi:hypothetical protein